MTEVKLFALGSRNVRFGTTEDGTPYAVAADYAKAFGYKRTQAATDLLDSDEKGYADCVTLGGTQRMSVIFEDGMWELIFRSTLPGAKALKKKVKEILRTIRETGRYEVELPALPSHLETAKELVAALERVEELKPKAEAHEIRGGEEVNRVTNIIRHRLGLTASTLSVPVMWERLRSIGALHPDSRLVTDEWEENGWAENNYSTPLFTAEGINEIERRMRKLRLVS